MQPHPSTPSPNSSHYPNLTKASSSPPVLVPTTPPSSNPPVVSPSAPINAKEYKPGATRKRCFDLILPSDEPTRPRKRMKKVFTTISAKREKEIEDLRALRMLQLARASREAFAAHVKYREKRIHELDVMRTIAHDEYEEAVSLAKTADVQVGEMRHELTSSGIEIATLSSLRLSPLSRSLSESSFVDGHSTSSSPTSSPIPPT